jgi:hypothetical protein
MWVHPALIPPDQSFLKLEIRSLLRISDRPLLSKNTTMKTLVIHPSDRSTDFLKPVYQDLTNTTIVTEGLDHHEVAREMDRHDRVIMMGHGCPWGLYAIGMRGDHIGLIVNLDHTKDILRNKRNTLMIWCNADIGARRLGLPGFSTGMFISEQSETFLLSAPVSDEVIDESNRCFTEALRSHIHLEEKALFNAVRHDYGRLLGHNPVAAYNHPLLQVQTMESLIGWTPPPQRIKLPNTDGTGGYHYIWSDGRPWDGYSNTRI